MDADKLKEGKALLSISDRGDDFDRKEFADWLWQHRAELIADAECMEFMSKRDVTVEDVGFIAYIPELGHDGSNLRAAITQAIGDKNG